DQFNVTLYGVTAVVFMTLQAFAGMWINAFIVSVICMAWVKKKTLNSNEKILLLLGCSRFWHLCFSWLYSFLSIIYPHCFYVQPIYTPTATLQRSFEFSNLWVTACLSVFYCAKIANFRNSFFIYLKVKIDRIVPWLLLGSQLLSLAMGILVYNTSSKEHSNNFNCQGNFSKQSIKIDVFFLTYFVIGSGFVTSFMTVTFSALLLLFSLQRHKRNMQTNSMKDLSMDAHIKAMKSILSFLVMYSVNFGFLILELTFTMNEENLMMFLIYAFLYAFPGVHSLILIFSNPKLEKTLLRILPCLKCK
ncbi:TA2R9 protein, partial [Sclerurus mexicanus]|nr:TA2R9 protein [Sclerurus mexicanus]